MITLRQKYVQLARRHNRAVLLYLKVDWPEMADKARELRDDFMRRARNAQEVA